MGYINNVGFKYLDYSFSIDFERKDGFFHLTENGI